MANYLIGIAGPSCSGKGEVAAWLRQQVNAVELCVDSYYHDQAGIPFEVRVLNNYDVPEALDWPLIVRQVSDLRAGQAVEKPVYDFSMHTRAAHTVLFQPAPVVILDGLFVLHHPEVRAMLDLKVFIDAPDEVCLARRTQRDIEQRGRRKEDILRQFKQQVQPSADKYIRPTKVYADVVLDGTAPVAESGGAVLAMFRSR